MTPVTTQQAAALLGITAGEVRRLIRTGALPAQRLGSVWMLDHETVAGYQRRPRGYPGHKKIS
jgi:excisionase family DNA binding protein